MSDCEWLETTEDRGRDIDRARIVLTGIDVLMPRAQAADTILRP